MAHENSYGECPPGSVAPNKHFFAKEDPTVAITNAIHSMFPEKPIIPERIDSILFDARQWLNIPQPANYHGIWPPTSASQLMNTDWTIDDMGGNRAANRFYKKHGEQINEECLGKICWQEADLLDDVYCLDPNCGHTFAEWLTGQRRWEERFEIRRVAGMGYGLFSKMNPFIGWRGVWKKGEILGAYLGELISERTHDTEYCHEVKIGPDFEKNGAPIAYIDARKYGNHVRFCNHSCERNAEISEVRVGKERVLALTATRRIAAGEEILIDYGSDYFRDGGCMCGSAKCKYPRLEDVATPMAVTEGPKRIGARVKIARRIAENSSVRHDSVLEEDSEVDEDSEVNEDGDWDEDSGSDEDSEPDQDSDVDMEMEID